MSVPVVQAIAANLFKALSGFAVIPTENGAGVVAIEHVNRDFSLELCKSLNIAQVKVTKKDTKTMH